MKKRYRLRKRSDFSYTYRKGKSVANSFLVLVYLKTNSPVTRVGFSVSKKFGKAVHRNKIKRRLREICRENLERIKGGYNLIFIVRKQARGANFDQLKDSMINLLERAGLFKENAW